jgi:Flp pilus assembly pilin Flp
LIAGLIAIAAIVVMRTLGGTIKNTYSTVNTALTTANAG